ncbi:MAG: SseB family protein [Mycobacterium sp.]|nr:SseB family protein [Mycobacterium sp.]
MTQKQRLVDNLTVRQAVGEFGRTPEQRTALNVLRACMYGELLFDTTGSTAFTDRPFEHGSVLQIRRGNGPGGQPALFAFTRHEEIARLYPPGARTQSMVTPATGALGLARHEGAGWLYIDPAGPTCALAAAEIDFALRNPNNEDLKAALADNAAGRADRRAIIHLLHQDGPLLLGADDSRPGEAIARTVTHPDGTRSLFAFTSGPEVLAFNPADAAAAMTTSQVLAMLRDGAYSELILNPAGPYVQLTAAEIFAA